MCTYTESKHNWMKLVYSLHLWEWLLYRDKYRNLKTTYVYVVRTASSYLYFINGRIRDLTVKFSNCKTHHQRKLEHSLQVHYIVNVHTTYLTKSHLAGLSSTWETYEEKFSIGDTENYSIQWLHSQWRSIGVELTQAHPITKSIMTCMLRNIRTSYSEELLWINHS